MLAKQQGYYHCSTGFPYYVHGKTTLQPADTQSFCTALQPELMQWYNDTVLSLILYLCPARVNLVALGVDRLGEIVEVLFWRVLGRAALLEHSTVENLHLVLGVVERLRVEGECTLGDKGGEEDDTAAHAELNASNLTQRLDDVAVGDKITVDDLAENRGEDGVEDDAVVAISDVSEERRCNI